jgi:hypothetical protein
VLELPVEKKGAEREGDIAVIITRQSRLSCTTFILSCGFFPSGRLRRLVAFFFLAGETAPVSLFVVAGEIALSAAFFIAGETTPASQQETQLQSAV